MAPELDDKKQKAYTNRRAITDLGMGVIYAGMGAFFLLMYRLGTNLDFPAPPFNYILGGFCVLYGGFRIYRGIKKDYYR